MEVLEVTLVTISAYVKAAGGGRCWGLHWVILHCAQGALSRPVGRGQDVGHHLDSVDKLRAFVATLSE